MFVKNGQKLRNEGGIFIKQPKDHVPIYSNGIQVSKIDLKERTRHYVDPVIFMCPNCLGTTFLGRDDENEEYEYDPHYVMIDLDTLYTHSEDEFHSHVSGCESPFPNDGIFRVDSEKQKEVAERVSYFSRNEVGWDVQLYNKYEHDQDVEVFLYVENGLVKGYVVFWKRYLNESDIYALWDIYTFPSFRGKGIASKLLDHALDYLKIVEGKFAVSHPIKPAAINIITKRTGKELTLIHPGGYHKMPTEEYIEKYVNKY